MAFASVGISHGICKDIAPLELFNACSKPTSSIFSSKLPGSPAPGKRPNLVPPVPNAQLGIATWKAISFFIISSVFAMPSAVKLNLRWCSESALPLLSAIRFLSNNISKFLFASIP